MQRRFKYGGLIFWALLIPIIAFLATKHLWFDSISADNKPIFWANVAVAAGTLALAIATVVSVSETRAVLAAEERRYQLAKAPMLHHRRFEQVDVRGGYHTDICIVITNSGLGIARELRGHVEGHFEKAVASAEVRYLLPIVPLIDISSDTPPLFITSFPEGADIRFIATEIYLQYRDMRGGPGFSDIG